MKKLPQTLQTAILTASVLWLAHLSAAAAPAAKKILFFSQSADFEHSVIKCANGQMGFAQKVLAGLGQTNRLEFTFTKDGRVFTPENIAKYDAFFFYTTGILTEPGKDGNPPMSIEGKAAFLRAIYKGKGFIGTHSSTDSFHSPGGRVLGPARWKNDGDNVDPYVRMIGAKFIVHGAQQAAHQICADPKFPGMSQLPADFRLLEEWYALKNFAPDLHVLLIQDTSGLEKTGVNHCYDRPSYPSTWAHRYGKGRVFYTAMGHREDVWTNPLFQQILLGGINWAVGNVEADVKPNMNKVTPQANVLSTQN